MLVSRRKPVSGGGGVAPTRAINTSIPLLGGGDLSVDRTHTFGPFNNNQYLQARDSTSTARTLMGITPLNNIEIGDFNIPRMSMLGQVKFEFAGSGQGSGPVLPLLTNVEEAAEPTSTGKLIFNTNLTAIRYWDGSAWVSVSSGSFVPLSRTINTTSPLTGGGNLSADRTIALGPFNNNAFLQGRTVGLVAKNLIGVNGSDSIELGDATVPYIQVQRTLVNVFMGLGVGSGLVLVNLTNTEEAAEPTVEGKVIYNTTVNVIKYWDGTQWVTLGTASSAVNVTRVPIGAKTFVTEEAQANTETYGAAPWEPTEHDISGTRKIYFRAILESRLAGTPVRVKLFNTAGGGSYVTNLDGGGNDYLQTTLTAPTLVTSHDLNGVGGDNFNEGSSGVYEAHIYTTDPNVQAVIHFAELIVKA